MFCEMKQRAQHRPLQHPVLHLVWSELILTPRSRRQRQEDPKVHIVEGHRAGSGLPAGPKAGSTLNPDTQTMQWLEWTGKEEWGTGIFSYMGSATREMGTFTHVGSFVRGGEEEGYLEGHPYPFGYCFVKSFVFEDQFTSSQGLTCNDQRHILRHK